MLNTYLGRHRDDMVQMLEHLVMMESFSPEKAKVDLVGQYLKNCFLQLGTHAETLPLESHGDMVKISFGSGKRQVLVLGHMDTVWPIGETLKRPFCIKDGRAYGPGVNDMKGGLVQGFWALKALIQARWRPHGRVVFLLNGDEETGSWGSRDVILKEAAKSEAVLVLEPATPSGSLKTERKGTMRLNLTVQGQPAHAGNVFNEGVSAIEEIAHHILFLQSLSDPKTQLSVNVNHVNGGGLCASVPDHASAQVDVRYWTRNDQKAFKARVETISPVLEGAGINFAIEELRPSMTRNPKNRLLYEMARGLALEMGFELNAGAVNGGSDGCFTSAAGIATLDGLGSVGGVGHSLDEHVVIDQMVPRAVLFAMMLQKLLKC
ncbi:M20 family metallopeptidase [Desulfocicer niacini]